MLAFRAVSRSIRAIVIFDIVAFGALVIVVIDLAICLTF
jgi:hypothetical protein